MELQKEKNNNKDHIPKEIKLTNFISISILNLKR